MIITRHVTRTVWTDITYNFDEDSLNDMKEWLGREVKDMSALPEITMDLVKKIMNDDIDTSKPEDVALYDTYLDLKDNSLYRYKLVDWIIEFIDNNVWDYGEWEDRDDSIDDHYDEIGD